MIELFDSTMTTETLFESTLGLLILGVPWSLIGGWIYFLAIVRPRRKIARRECLLLGVVLGELMPFPMVSLIFAVDDRKGLTEVFGDPALGAPYFIGIFSGSEILLSLTGLLGGWLFWRFGVRPAPVPQPDVSAVFD